MLFECAADAPREPMDSKPPKVLPLRRFMNFRSGRYAHFGRRVWEVSALAVLVLLVASFVESARAQAEADDDPAAIFNQAQDLHAKGDLAGAIRLYDRALKAESNFPEAEYQRAAAELALGHPDSAEKGFRKALELRPDWPLPLTSLGSLLLDSGRLTEAEAILTKAVDLEPNNSSALIALTEMRIGGAAKSPALEDLLTKITSLTGRANATAQLWSARAALENALNRRSAAKLSLGRALSVDPKNRSALFLHGEISTAEGDFATAIETAAILESLPGSTDKARLLKAKAYAAEGKLAEALAALDSLSKPNSASSDLRAKINTARSTSAPELEKQLETSPRDSAILGRLCTMYRRDNPAKALDYCRRASEVEPANVAHAVGFAAALVQAKQYDSAIGILRKIIELAPENFTAHANLATALFFSKQYAPATLEFRWLIAKQPNTAGAYFFLAVIQDETGLFADALTNYQQYLRLADPEANRVDIERVNLRLPVVQKLAKEKKK
jgi:tetratricopeptide (TPR) repeat protein